MWESWGGRGQPCCWCLRLVEEVGAEAGCPQAHGSKWRDQAPGWLQCLRFTPEQVTGHPGAHKAHLPVQNELPIRKGGTPWGWDGSRWIAALGSCSYLPCSLAHRLFLDVCCIDCRVLGETEKGRHSLPWKLPCSSGPWPISGEPQQPTLSLLIVRLISSLYLCCAFPSIAWKCPPSLLPAEPSLSTRVGLPCPPAHTPSFSV